MAVSRLFSLNSKAVFSFVTLSHHERLAVRILKPVSIFYGNSFGSFEIVTGEKKRRKIWRKKQVYPTRRQSQNEFESAHPMSSYDNIIIIGSVGFIINVHTYLHVWIEFAVSSCTTELIVLAVTMTVTI